MRQIEVLKALAIKYWKYYNKDKTIAYLKEHCKEESIELIRQADMLLEQTFIFQDKWDMEPCNVPYKMTLGNWIESPNGDEEWIFMLNRHEFLPKLWYAWMLTGEEKYVNKLRWYIFDWMNKNPITEKGTDAIRTIDTGIRCMNWTGLLLPMYAEGFWTDEELLELLASLGEQFQNLKNRYIPKYSLSNWGVLQTTAMCAAYVWFREFLPKDIEEWAWSELANQLDLQILEDGAHWEQSAMYHVEVLNTCTKLFIHMKNAQSVDWELSEEALEAINEISQWDDEKEAHAYPGEGMRRKEAGWLVSAIRVLNRHVLYTADPSWKQLPQCDSDVTDVKDVMVRAAVILQGGGIYRYAAGKHLELDSVFLLGEPGIDRFEKTNPYIPLHSSWICQDAGNIFFRTKWGKDANFTWVKNSTLGSGHGHADQTHFHLTHKGKPFLVDSGRYTYREDNPKRMQLKNPQAHNVCVIDDKSGGNADTSWTMSSYGEVIKNYFREKSGVHYVEMPFYQMMEDGTVYLINRKIMMIDEGIWLSVQDIICPGKHKVKEYFHLDNEVHVSEGCGVWNLKNDGVTLKVYSKKTLYVENGVISKKYNELDKTSVLIKESDMEDRMTDCTLFVAENVEVKQADVYQVGKESEIAEDFVTAWDIVVENQRKWTLLIWNRETFRGGKMYLCNGVPIYGKAVAVKWDDTGVKRIRLKT